MAGAFYGNGKGAAYLIRSSSKKECDEVVDVVMRVDNEMLKWLGMKKFPDDRQELIDAIRDAVYLAYAMM